MLTNLKNGKEYYITGVLEQGDGSYHVAMDLNDKDFPTTSMGILNGRNGLQELSDLAWDHEELEKQAMEFLNGQAAMV